MARTLDDLKQMQALPLSLKVSLTKARIRQWVNEYGEDGVVVSFSGGKDSTVLLTIVRQMYPSIKAVFVDTGLEYPEIREFVRSFDNVEFLKPKMNFKKVIEQYGYPFISKEVSECVFNAKLSVQYGLKKYKEFYDKINGTGEFSNGGRKKQFSAVKYRFFLNGDAPNISHICCRIMKKTPIHEYCKRTGFATITAEMAQESRRRQTTWILHGCNMFDAKHPKSTPMAFWTEQDVLHYIKENSIPLASVYGDIVCDEKNSTNVEGQMQLNIDGTVTETQCTLKTTGCQRTGCMFCGFGCHLEKQGESRFVKMKQTHPKQYEWIMKPWSEGGLGYKDVIDWINEHGNLNIKY